MPRHPWAIRRWDLYAPHYDRWVGFEAQRRRSLELAALLPGERVLIAGCGTGLDLPLLPQGVEIDAIDLSPGMLELARARAAGLNARIHLMDAQRLHFPDHTFDCVVLHLIVAIVPDHLRCLREAVRVLKPGGRIVVFDKYFGGPGKPRLIRRLLNPLLRLAATDLNVPLPRIAAEAGLVITHQEPAALRGMFGLLRLEPKTRSSSSAE